MRSREHTMGDPMRDGSGLSRAGTGQHHDRTFEDFGNSPLFGI
jgi:hypothetical protein